MFVDDTADYIDIDNHQCPICGQTCSCPEPDECIGCWDCAEAREHAGEDTY